MGEVYKKMGLFNIGQSEVEVELNQPRNAASGYQVHLQSADERLELQQADFIKMAAAVLFARNQLLRYKDNGHD